VGSAVNDTTRELGGALGVAVLGSLVASRYAAGLHRALVGLPAGVQDAARRSVGGAVGAASQLQGRAAGDLALAARTSFAHAMAAAMVAAACVALAAGVIVSRVLPARVVPGEAEARQPAAGDRHEMVSSGAGS
jgi:hypothetical protein